MINKTLLSGLFLLVLSCNAKEEKLEMKDVNYQKVSKFKTNELTKISYPYEISLDSIAINEVDIEFVIKNTGKKDLQSFIIEFHCSCISKPKYKEQLKPNEEQSIKMKFPIDKKGNFQYSIYLYGNFYPYQKKILVTGFRK